MNPDLRSLLKTALLKQGKTARIDPFSQGDVTNTVLWPTRFIHSILLPRKDNSYNLFPLILH